jgi:hypothetical protein
MRSLLLLIIILPIFATSAVEFPENLSPEEYRDQLASRRRIANDELEREISRQVGNQSEKIEVALNKHLFIDLEKLNRLRKILKVSGMGNADIFYEISFDPKVNTSDGLQVNELNDEVRKKLRNSVLKVAQNMTGARTEDELIKMYLDRMEKDGPRKTKRYFNEEVFKHGSSDLRWFSKLMTQYLEVSAKNQKHINEVRRVNRVNFVSVKDFKLSNDLLKCSDGDDSAPIFDLDLSRQFPKTYSQTGGSCWSYAGTSTVEAAAKRATGKVQSFSPLYSASCAVADNPTALEAQVGDLVKDVTTNPNESPTLVDGGLPQDAIDNMLDRDNICREFGEFEVLFNQIKTEHCDAVNQFNDEKSGNIQVASSGKEIAKLGLDTTRVTCPTSLKSTLQTDFKSRIGEFSESEHVEKFDFKDYRRINLSAHTFNRDVYSSTQTDGQMTHENCNLKNEANKKVIKEIVKQLCLGRPVATSLFMHMVNKSNDGGGAWSPYLGSAHSFHAMVITGIDYDSTGRPHFIMRNSWKEGDATHKDKSLASIPVEQACRIYDNQTVLAPGEKITRPVKNLDQNRLLKSFN